MKSNRIFITIGLFLVTSLTALAQSPLPAPSTWVSGNKADTLVIESISDQGEINGYYMNKEGTWGCKGKKIPVQGSVNGNVLSFSITYSACGRLPYLMSWVGAYIENEDHHGKKGLITRRYLLMDETTDSKEFGFTEDIFIKKE